MFSTSSRAPLFLSILAALLMVLVTAYQGYQFWQEEAPQPSQNAALPDQKLLAEARKIPDVPLSTLSLFGKENTAEQAQAEVSLDDLPETNLKLTLRGVMAASGDFPGSALIEDDKLKTDAYLVGDDLPGSANLKTVGSDRIIIQRSGVLESLYFPEENDRTGIVLSSHQTSPDSGDAVYTETIATPASFSGESTKSPSSDQRRQEIRQRLEQLRERLRTNN